MKKTILLFTTLLCIVLLHAQNTENNNNNPYNLPLSNEEFFEQAEIVFEGYFIKIVATYDATGNGKREDWYRISAYKVHRVYKGVQYVEEDTIYIVTRGGNLGDENIVENPNENVSYYIPPVLHRNGINCAPKQGSPAIFFLIKSDFHDDENSKYFSYNKYKSLKGGLHICGNVIAGLNDLVFRQREDFYNYMNQFEKFTVPEPAPQLENQTEKKPYNKAEIDSLHNEVIKRKWGDHKKKTLKNPEKNSADITLTLQLANQELVYDNTQHKYYVKFDLMASTNSPHLYFDAIYIRIGYDPAIFGANISENGKISVSAAPLFHRYWLFAPYDQYPDGFQILFLSGGPREKLDTAPMPLMHFQIELLPSPASMQPHFTFIDTAYTASFSAYTLNINDPFSAFFIYDKTYFLDYDTLPVITTPLHAISKVAGINEILTIQGLNFGSTQGSGTVCFKAADDGGNTYLKGLDNQYIKSWNSTKIEVSVPSYISKIYQNDTTKHGGAGTGTIKIVTNNGNSCISAANLHIPYSITNAYDSIDNLIRRVYLTRKNCEYDFQFILQNYFGTHPLSDTMINIIDKAFRDWSALTGLTIALERDGAGNPVIENWSNYQGKYIIAPRNSGAMGTYNSVHRTTVGSERYLYCTAGYPDFITSHISINLNPKANVSPYDFSWNYDTLSSVIVPYGYASFYQAFMHEIGHILLLDHVNNSSNLMYYSITSGKPIINLSPTDTTVLAVKANIEASQVIDWSAVVPSLTQPPLYSLGGGKKPQITILSHNSPIICSKTPLLFLSSNYPTGNLWSTGETTQTIQVDQSGKYWVKFTDDDCEYPADTVNITFSLLNASFSVSNAICYNTSTGSVITNVRGLHPPYTYYWTGNGITPATTANLYNLSAGTYHLELSNSAGCTVNYSVSVSQPDPLTVTIDTIYSSSPRPTPIEFFANVSDGTLPYTYQWSAIPQGMALCPGFINTNFPSLPISYDTPSCRLKLTVTDANGCQVVTSPSGIYKSFISQEENSFVNNEITLFPNPTSGTFTISNVSNATVYVYTALSSHVKTFEHVSYSETMNIGHLPSGIYFIKIVEGNIIKNEKLILSK